MKKNLLTAAFSIIGIFCTFTLFADLLGYINLTYTQFVIVGLFGITNAFVYSELIFNENDNTKH
jgi:uncharacterized membrane protein YuzA (DUF378 family)